MTQSLICEIRGIGKSFGTVRALDGVDLNVRRGEIHALVGENGAGKTTLIRVLAGVIRPDSGTLLFAGRPIHLRGPQDAVAHGIAVIHQAPALFSWRSAAENCFNQAGLPGRLLIRWSQVRTQARQALAEFGADALWRRPAAALSTSQQQIVALAGARLADPELWILDEPTASLSVEDSSRLFAILDRQRSAGKGVIYVSHRLPEVLRHADRITVLRDGRIVRTAAARDFDSDSLVAAMVGRRLDAYYPERAPAAAGDPALRVTALTDAAGSFKDVHLQLGHGEILGIYGLVGAGRSELGQAIAGQRPSVGRVESAGTVTYLPEDRLREGNLTGLSARENLSISALTKLKKSLLVDRGDERRLVAEFWDRLGIRGPGAEAAIETFSGGNQQKVLLGRCLSTRPRVLILDEPTQGIDVAARAEIHRIVTELAAAGHAILLISSDLPEVLGMCHRVLVLRTGRVAAVLDAGSTSEEEVGAAALPVRSEFPEVPTGDTGAQRRTSAGRPRQRAGRTVPREVSVLLVMLVVLVGTGIRSPGFLTAGSLRDVATNSAALAVVTIGQTLVIAGGGIDISVGSMLALCAAAAAAVAAAQWGVAACLAVSVVLGAGLGSINAGISSLGRLHPIITTLGTLGIFRGVYLFWTGGDWVRLSPRMLALATTGPFGLAWTVWMAALYAAAVGLFLRWTRTGRACLKVGDNPLAASHFGLRVGRIRWCAFTVLGSAVGLGAILHTSRFGQVQNNTGVGFELQTIAAAVLGGAHVAGGRGTVLGAVLGAALIGLIAAARSVWEIDERWQLVIVGGLMLGAVALEALFQRNAWTVRPARARNAMR